VWLEVVGGWADGRRGRTEWSVGHALTVLAISRAWMRRRRRRRRRRFDSVTS